MGLERWIRRLADAVMDCPRTRSVEFGRPAVGDDVELDVRLWSERYPCKLWVAWACFEEADAEETIGRVREVASRMAPGTRWLIPVRGAAVELPFPSPL